MPIIFRISRGASDFTTDLVARYLFTSDASDSLGNYSDVYTGSGVTFSSSGARLQPTSNHKIRFGADGLSNLSTTMNDLNGVGGTISFWVKMNTGYTTGGTADNRYIFGSYRGGSANQRGVHFGYFDQNSVLASGAGGWHFFNSASPASAGYEGIVATGDSGTSEVHIVVTIDNGDFRMYKDGSLVGTETASYWPEYSLEWEVNGSAGSYLTSRMFDGWFKDLCVWDGRVLSAAEVAALYSNGSAGSF